MFEFGVGSGLINIGSEDLAKVLNNRERVSVFGGSWSDIDNISQKLANAKGLAVFLKADEENFHLDKVGEKVEKLVGQADTDAKIIWGVQKADKPEFLVLAGW